MPNRERVAALIALVEEGMFVDAVNQFYAEDVRVQDNFEAPRQGRAQLLVSTLQMLRSFRRLQVRPVQHWTIDGDQVVIRWQFEFTGHDGRRRMQEETAQQRWSGDRIVDEHRYYDPAQQPLAPSVPIPVSLAA